MSLPSRNTVFWWLYVVALAAAALFIGYSFVGIIVVGVFGYYATRPISTRLERRVDSDTLAAGLTVLTVLVPVLVLAVYAGIRMFQQINTQLEQSVLSMVLTEVVGIELGERDPAELLSDPPSVGKLTDLFFGSAFQQGLHVLDLVFGAVLLLSLAVTLSYALLLYDDPLSNGFGTLVGRDSTVYSYALAVDSDLESVFFGNLLFVLVMSLVAIATYALTNVVAPPGLRIPMVFTLGVLTGLASIVPIIVGKVVYVPIVGYLAFSSAQNGDAQLVFLGALLVVYFLVLDILPQSFLQPYISGQQMNPMVLLFAYILGPVMFGWYGFFLLPIVFVLMLEVVRIVLPELLHGERIDTDPDLAEETGADAEEMQEDDPDQDDPPEEVPPVRDDLDPDRG